MKKRPLQTELTSAKAAGDLVAYDRLLIQAADLWEIPSRAAGTGKRRTLDSAGRNYVETALIERGYDL